MIAEQDCLKCHDFQGYRVGDIRGGVSVSVPMNAYMEARRQEILSHGISFGILWTLGLIGIGFATYVLKRGIRARDEAEESLRISEKRYSTLVDSSLTGIYAVQDGEIKFANSKFAEIHGWKREEIIGMQSSSMTHPEDRAYVDGIREKRLRGEECVSEYETRDLTKYGEMIWVLRRNTLCTYDGKPAVLGNLMDITERKRMEDQLRRSEIELRHLSSRLILAQEAERKKVADEIYDGLAQNLIGIKYQMETLKGKMTEHAPTDPNQMFDPFITAIQEMVQEIRRITSGLRPRVVDELGLIPAISSLCRDLRRLDPHIRLEEEITLQESDIPPSLRISIYRIVEESLMNTLRHSNATTALVSLHKSSGEIELTVSDNGLGFDIAKIFTQDNVGGGLGLAYMKERAKLSGGVLQIRTDCDKGTVLRAAWPVNQLRQKADP
jgi:PAS domain S-box-containing protein